MKKICWKAFSAALMITLALSLLPFHGNVVQAVSTSVVISQVYGGGGNSGATYKNDFIELYNLSSNPVDVTGWTVQYASASGTTWQTTPLSGTIDPGKYYLVQEAMGSGGTVNLPTPNATGTIAMSGTAGKVALVSKSTALSGSCPAGVVDFVGYGAANCFEGSGPTPSLSNTTAALRNGNGATDTDNNSADFTVGAPNPRNTPPPDAAPAVASTVPADGASSVPYDTNITITFSEPVNVTSSWFTLSCSVSGNHTATVSGGPVTYTVNPDTDFVSGDNCTLTVLKDQVSDQDSNDPPDNMSANFAVGFSTANACTLDYTHIYDIEGSGSATPLSGQTVTTQGVVVGDYEGASPALRGFFLQDLSGDGNPATSDGIFVFESDNSNSVNLGDVVRVTGTAGENQGQTQITKTSIVSCGTGSVDPVDVTLPFTSATDVERYEGMLVRLPQTLTVTEMYQLGRFDEVLLSSGGRLKQPTNVAEPGAPAQALQDQNNLNQILIDDASQAQNPDPILFGREGKPLSASNTLRGGDTATGIVGVMTYTWGGNSASPNAYRVRPINALNGYVDFESSNPRPTEAPAPSGRIRVVGMNLLNFFNTFTGCTNGVGGAATDCRGAENQTEFDRQWPKTVVAIVATKGDVIGVTEMENDGYGADSALQFLVEKLNAATAQGTYAFINADEGTGQVNALGLDAIKVALIYKTAKVSPVGKTAALNSVDFVNGGDSAPRNRAALAQAFEEVGTSGRFVVSVNHLKSKGSACDAPDTGDGQGNCAVVRTNAAKLLTAWLASDPTGTGDPDALIIGDLNSYAMEEPITAIKSAGYTDLAKKFEGESAYSYVFDGQWGYLDHALSNASLTPQIIGVTDWHINSDEPSVLDYNTNFKTANLINSLYAPDEYRVADHDPVLIDLNPNAPPKIGTITAPLDPMSVGTELSISAAFTDPDQQDTHKATWDWGDGSTSNGSITEDSGSGKVAGTHTYTTSGVYTVKLTVTDEFGYKDTAAYQYVVVYDPEGGFVTGGGWINSPAGAYPQDPNLAGKASFGFVSKYQKGTNVPAGDTEFQFKAADLNFNSTAYDWLVIAGAKAQYKGSGTINGAGEYGFMLTAVDGQVSGGGGTDTFRLKIWDKATGTVIYDNQMGASDTSTPTTALGGGSIVIHK